MTHSPARRQHFTLLSLGGSWNRERARGQSCVSSHRAPPTTNKCTTYRTLSPQHRECWTSSRRRCPGEAKMRRWRCPAKPPALDFSFELRCWCAHKNKTGCELQWRGLANTAASAEKWYVCDCVSSCRWSPLRKRKLVGCDCPPLPPSSAVSCLDGHIWSQGLFLTFFVDFCAVLSEKLYEKRLHQSQFPPQRSKFFYQQTGHLLGLLWLEAACSNHCCEPQVILQTSFQRNETARSHHSVCFFSSGKQLFHMSVKITYFKWWIDQGQSWGI